MQDIYQKKLKSFADSIQVEKANLAQTQSKIMTQGDKIINKVHELQSFHTPIKKTTNTSALNTASSTNNKGTVSKINTMNISNQNVLPANNNNPAAKMQKLEQQNIELKQIVNKFQKYEIQSRAQIEGLKQSNKVNEDIINQMQKGKQTAKMKAKQLEKERMEHQKQLQAFLNSTHKLRDLLQDRSKFVQIQVEKVRSAWNEQNKRHTITIENLNGKIQVKDKKIQQMLEIIANLRQQLKAALQKIKQQEKIIKDQQMLISNYKQQIIELKLQNKNLKADNKIAITHLDKMLKQKLKDNEKSAKQIFQERQQRVINSLYAHTIITPKQQKNKLQLFPSQRNELSNKIKLQKMTQDYESYRRQSTILTKRLQNRIKQLEELAKSQETQIRILQINLRKTNELRDAQKQSLLKSQNLIFEYEKQLQQLTRHNESISTELSKCYRFPKIKQGVGYIVSSPGSVKKFKNLKQLYQYDS